MSQVGWVASAGTGAPGQTSVWPAIQPMPSEQRHLRDVTFLLFGAAILLRLAIAPQVLNEFVSYTAEGGSLHEKIHPGTYLLVAAFVLALFGIRTEISGSDRKALRWLVVLFGAVVFSGLAVSFFGHPISAGYLIDSYVAACMAGYLTIVLTPPQREVVVGLALVFLAANSALTLIEFIIGRGIFLPGYNDGTFRPAGLLNHPLSVGGMNVGAVVYVFLTRWSARAKAVCVTLLLLGIFAAGARTATAFGGIAFLGAVLLTPQPGVPTDVRLQRRILVVLACLGMIPLALGILDAAGFLERFKSGIVDQSSLARVDIYKVFDYVGWDEIIFGADITEIQKIAKRRLNIDFIESVVVVFVFQFGLPLAVLFIGTVVLALFRLAAGGGPRLTLGVLAYLAVALSNNALATKDFTLALTIVFLIALRSAVDRRTGDPHAVAP